VTELKQKVINKKVLASVFIIAVIESIGAMGIVTTIHVVKAIRAGCNPSSDGCTPPGQRDFGNSGQCQKTLNEFGDKEESHFIYKNGRG
jgi:hypothetical protein